MTTADGATMGLPDKSTNVRYRAVRTRPIATPDFRWASFQVLSRLAPGLAGRLAAKLFLTPPPPRPLSGKMIKLVERASDRFSVGLTTELGGLEEKCRLQVTVWGQGPAVYLLHGWGGRGAHWMSFIEPLTTAGFSAVVLDAPMHGDSPAQRTSILHFAAALSAVVESVGPALLLVGHSAGAAACSLALQKEPLSPWGTLDGVVKHRAGGLDARGVALLGAPADPAALFASFLRRVGVGEKLHQSIRADIEHRYGFRWDSLAIRPPDRSPHVAALVIHDRDDRDIAYEDAERIARGWPDAKLVATQGLGHQRILRDDRVVQHVVDFARSLES